MTNPRQPRSGLTAALADLEWPLLISGCEKRSRNISRICKKLYIKTYGCR